MADQKPTPQQIAARIASLLTAAAASRSSLLHGFADDAQQEAAALRKVRDAVAQKTGADDPAVQALDQRSAGTDQLASFLGQTLEQIGPPAPQSLGDWVVTGLVLDAKSKPVAGATITLIGDDELARRFGEVTSGKDGKFEVRFPGAELKDIFARAPKVRLTVRSKDGKLEATTADFVPKSDGIELVEIRLLGKTAAPAPAKPGKKAEEGKKNA